MGRFRAEAVLIRRTREVVITFYDKETIYVAPRGYANMTVFHRWFAPRGSYQSNWAPFRRQLLRQKHLNIAKCCELANRYGVLYIGTVRAPSLKEKNVKYRDY